MPSDIGTKQNSPEALRLLRGARQAYAQAKRLGKIQLGLSISAALASPLAAQFAPEGQPYVALYGAAVLFVDLLFIEAPARRYQETGAQIQELFDAQVLAFPWKGRHRPDAEVRHLLAKEYGAGDKGAPLKNWYPSEVDVLPTEQARLVCQRSNMKWDASLREHVWQLYAAALLVLVLGALTCAMVKNLSIAAAVVQILVPVIPVGVRLARKLIEHKTAAEDSDRAKRDVDRLWSRVGSGEFTSRELDNEGARCRRTSSNVVVGRLRFPMSCASGSAATEEQMAAAAAEMVDQALGAPPRAPS
ncbi:MAG: hypothetical protein IPF92_30440 [Myxococcales bacterium]|nr:hypothetical protein [Myxococcales bacterium]